MDSRPRTHNRNKVRTYLSGYGLSLKGWVRESGVWGKNGNKVTYDGCDWKLNGTRIEFIDELPD